MAASVTGGFSISRRPRRSAGSARAPRPRRRRSRRRGPETAEYHDAGPVQDLIDELGRLPGVGPKSAQRIAFHLLKLPPRTRCRLAEAIVDGQGAGRASADAASTSRRASCAGICADDRAGTADRLRGRGAPRHRRGGADRRVPRPLPRAAGRHQPDRGRRSRAAARPGAAGPRRAPRASTEVILVHQPEHRGRGDRHVPRPAAQAARA